jgi:hypothetical protein
LEGVVDKFVVALFLSHHFFIHSASYLLRFLPERRPDLDLRFDADFRLTAEPRPLLAEALPRLAELPLRATRLLREYLAFRRLTFAFLRV